jgi:hypothetical protein
MSRNHKPWIKLHIKTLHNFQTAELSDSSYRRFMECLLFAGEERNNAIQEGRDQAEGFLPPVPYMAWTLHTTVQNLSDDLSRLALAGLVSIEKDEEGVDRWFVTHFAKWQAPSSAAERMQQYRDAQARYENVTPPSRKRNLEVEEEVEVEGEGEVEAEVEAAAAASTAPALLACYGIGINARTRPLLALDLDYLRAHLEHAAEGGINTGLTITRMLAGDPAPRKARHAYEDYADVIKR